MHQCDHCNYEFKDEKHLMSHIRYVHPNIQEETNSAQPGPSWEDGQYSKYSNRNSCIENNRPYESYKVCHQRFHRKLELIYHYKNVHQRLMHQCEHCAYETNNEVTLQKYIVRKHMDGYMYCQRKVIVGSRDHLGKVIPVANIPAQTAA
ncbi:hypothetical protein EAI_04997 [Harpegnathos saltator]|uniref:C2H2-type domain-containing protein n=1 Tax=Harpegnathos saltator TaxID=610380 RepID=E2C186_HARSA|nr:hypothetical protein EAI_04997 [Harpegnathos saltator]